VTAKGWGLAGQGARMGESATANGGREVEQRDGEAEIGWRKRRHTADEGRERVDQTEAERGSNGGRDRVEQTAAERWCRRR